ncbi:FtsX-like permease family protein [Psychrosphaera sp.]|nr:FtsX-like permease family protein [Psychrosphaera sp.]
MQSKLSTWLGLSFRLFKREFGRGELTVIALSIVLAVSSVMALSSLTDRVQASILMKSAEFLAADKDLVSPTEIKNDVFEYAESLNIKTDQHIYFSSMAFAGDKMNLAVVKAVTQSYPLRGELFIESLDNANEVFKANGPDIGSVWISKRLYFALGESNKIDVGEGVFTVAGIIDAEPDAPFQVFNSGTRVIMNINDIPKTEVIQPGSRVTYAGLFAGETQALEKLESWIKPKLSESQKFRGVKEGASNITSSLERAESFLMLAGVLGVLLAAVAISVSARLYSQRHLDSIAIMKTLGASVRQVQVIYLTQLCLIAVVSIIIGLVVGSGLQNLALISLAEYLPKDIPDIGYRPFLVSIVTGFVCALMFSVPALLKLFKVPPLRVLRRNLGDGVSSSISAQLIMASTTIGLVWFYSQDLKLTGIVLGSGFVLSILIVGISRLLLVGFRSVSKRIDNPSLKLAIASLQRRSKENVSQIIGFTLAIMLVLILFSLKNSIIQEWQEQIPDGAPNHFIINISQQNIEKIEQRFSEKGIAPEQFYPIIRGRLTQINDEVLKQKRPEEAEDGAKFKGKGEFDETSETADKTKEKANKDKEEARTGFGRELNLTFTDRFPNNNELVEGTWMPDDAQKQVSVEAKVAERLKLKLGDELSFLIGSQTVSATVTSIRTVDWNSLQPNFYMIFSDDVIDDFPATYITSFYLAKEDKLWLNELLADYPTLSIIDVAAMLEQIQSVIAQVSVAIQFVLLIVVIAATLVLVAQVQSSLDERRKETVIYRTIGAKGSVIRNAISYEFISLGAISGFIAASVAEFSLYLLQTYSFKMTWVIHWELWIIGPLSGAVFVAVVGSLSTRSLLKITPSELIRQLA